MASSKLMLWDQNQLELLAAKLGEALSANHHQISVAESCTGGWLAQCLTAISGSSAWFECGFVTYSNAAKERLLGVPAISLHEHGAVSEVVAAHMAEGAATRSQAHWAIAITGIAGPAGGTPQKPVGTVCFAWVNTVQGQQNTYTSTQHFVGTRHEVRAQSVAYALQEMLGLIARRLA